ncbi:hypothetical protein A3K69_06385 [Candidatus Bathyarchaeota archaeon RBG_16_57_9]|nr:MAG: hypothetical protein A3K69_06385 [Candidatus Bathyarchaeota archaeon RBG_16_57_9]OGD54421.1 MAG: hypothetical protein A3K81_06070 [Candidatus Bathyarchaeota archaeon RBG_13_60_20]
MSRIVSNATPLIYLAKIGRLSLLKAVFGEVLVPQEVKAEVVDRGKEIGEVDAYIVEAALEEGWLKVVKTDPIKIPLQLDAGETAALSLARKLSVEVLVDEVSARMAARLMSLTPRGTLYVLLKALEMSEINLDEFNDALGDLVRNGFRLREEVYLEALKKAREIAHNIS